MGFDHIARLGSALSRARRDELHSAVRAWLLAPVVEASLALADEVAGRFFLARVAHVAWNPSP